MIIIINNNDNNNNNCESAQSALARVGAAAVFDARAFAAEASYTTLVVVVVARRVHSPLWEDLPEASSYARIGSTRVLRGRPRNRLRRNRARGCSRISSADRAAASIGHFPCPRPEDRCCRGGASVLRCRGYLTTCKIYIILCDRRQRDRRRRVLPTGFDDYY